MAFEQLSCWPAAEAGTTGIDLGTKNVVGSELRFMTVGDWGVVGCVHDDCNSTRAQEMANAMGVRAVNLQPHFVISVGDHFYQDGVNSTTSPRWETTFNDLFAGTNGSLDVPFYGVLGNHDWEPNEDNYLAGDSEETWDQGTRSQIEYTSSKERNRFCLPSYYYTFAYKTEKVSVRFVAFDSIFIQNCPAPDKTTGPMCHGKSVPPIEPFWKWFNSVLENATEDFVIPFAHHPLISIGKHGLTNTNIDGCRGGPESVMTGVGNILLQNKVPMYISGHDHNTELFVGTSKADPGAKSKWGKPLELVSLLTGSFGKTDGATCGAQGGVDAVYNADVESKLKWQMRYGSVEPAYSAITLNATHLVVEVLDKNNKILTSYESQYSNAAVNGASWLLVVLCALAAI